MRTRYFIQEGFIVKKYDKSDKDVPSLFSLDKWFKKMLDRFHVAYTDDCCEEDGFYPLRYNAAEGRVEQYNGTAWVDYTSFTTSTTTTTTSTTTTTTTAAPTTTTTTTTP